MSQSTILGQPAGVAANLPKRLALAAAGFAVAVAAVIAVAMSTGEESKSSPAVMPNVISDGFLRANTDDLPASPNLADRTGVSSFDWFNYWNTNLD